MTPASRTALLTIAACVVSVAAFGRAEVANRGEWPAAWPKELEPLREVSRTIHFTSAVDEMIYEIPFRDRQQFEALWPVILTLKSPKAPLRIDAPGFTDSGGLEPPMVRIYAPSEADVGVYHREDRERKRAAKENATGEAVESSDPSDRILHAGPPWPETVTAEDGVLPEYVRAATVDGERTWVPADEDSWGSRARGFRARIEIELVVDGRIIDLNRIVLPEDTPIIDNRTPIGSHALTSLDANEN